MDFLAIFSLHRPETDDCRKALVTRHRRRHCKLLALRPETDDCRKALVTRGGQFDGRSPDYFRPETDDCRKALVTFPLNKNHIFFI